MAIDELALWADGIEEIEDGTVTNHEGRPVHFRSLVKRRWGWPKKAAYRAADYLLEAARENDSRAVLAVSKRRRDAQQKALFEELPGLLEDLLHGLSRGVAQREAIDASHVIRSLEVAFDYPISDDGFSADVLHAIANRLGCSVEELRGAIRFDTGTPDLVFDVRAEGFDP
jgi:hypothetical protein